MTSAEVVLAYNWFMMSWRIPELQMGEIYHVFNRTLDKKRIFTEKWACVRFLDLLYYYRSTKANIAFSIYQDIAPDIQKKIQRDIAVKKDFRVTIFAYCIMPTHFHLLLRQNTPYGTSEFLSLVLNSFTKSYNARHDRIGSLFLRRFPARSPRNSEIFLHVSRYIHLNPFAAGLVADLDGLVDYPWSSFGDYVNEPDDDEVYMTRKFGVGGVPFCDTKKILDLFGGDRKAYKNFVHDNAKIEYALVERTDDYVP